MGLSVPSPQFCSKTEVALKVKVFCKRLSLCNFISSAFGGVNGKGSINKDDLGEKETLTSAKELGCCNGIK